MGVNISFGLGWGLKLNKKSRAKLESYILHIMSQLEPDHAFHDSPWYAKTVEELYLEDAIEDLYENLLVTKYSGNAYNSPTSNFENFLFAKSTLQEVDGFQSISLGHTLPKEISTNEVTLLTEIANNLNIEPQWYLFGSMG